MAFNMLMPASEHFKNMLRTFEHNSILSPDFFVVFCSKLCKYVKIVLVKFFQINVSAVRIKINPIPSNLIASHFI